MLGAGREQKSDFYCTWESPKLVSTTLCRSRVWTVFALPTGLWKALKQQAAGCVNATQTLRCETHILYCRLAYSTLGTQEPSEGPTGCAPRLNAAPQVAEAESVAAGQVSVL